MGQKIFIEKDGFKLISDDRDVMVPSKYCYDVITWCHKMGIKLEVAFTESEGQYLAKKFFDVDMWRVKDDQERMMFTLRWS
jgi:hypothetical protein